MFKGNLILLPLMLPLNVNMISPMLRDESNIDLPYILWSDVESISFFSDMFLLCIPLEGFSHIESILSIFLPSRIILVVVDHSAEDAISVPKSDTTVPKGEERPEGKLLTPSSCTSQ
jgi:hypothetical protein